MKLKYNGFLKTGIVKLPDGSSISVIRGDIYDVNEKFSSQLLASGWESVYEVDVKSQEVKKEHKKYNKIIKTNIIGGE